MLSFILNVTVKKDCVDKAVKALCDIDRVSQDHPGKISFMWFEHLEEPQKFTLVEQWENQAALDAHIPRIIDIWNEFIPCLDQDPVSIKLKKLVT